MDEQKLEVDSKPEMAGSQGSERQAVTESQTQQDLEKVLSHHTTSSMAPVAKAVTAQDWNGPDDPENPMNWSILKRSLHVAAVAFLAFAVTSGSSMITPATQEISEHFNVSRTASLLSLSLFVLGLGLGPCLAAPLSETQGRSVVYKISGLVYMLFILGGALSPTFGGLLICRLLAGCFGGPVLAVGSGTIADMFPLQLRAIPSSFYILAPFLGPALGPVIGGFAAQFKSYKWTQWCTIFVGIAAWVSVLLLSETYKKTILQRRAKRLNLPPPPAAASTRSEMIKKLVTITLARPVTMLFTEPIVLLFSLYVSFLFSVLFAFFAAYPYTFETVYRFNTWQSGLTFLGIGLGNIIGVIVFVIIDRKVYVPKHAAAMKQGLQNISPEHRLYAAMVGAPFVPVGLFWYAWTARASVHWIVPILAGIPFAFGNLSVFASTVSYLIDVYGPLNGASAVAANGFARYSMGAGFPLFTVQMYQTLGIGWATSLLGFLSVAMTPIPFVFFKYGSTIRRKSRYDTIKA